MTPEIGIRQREIVGRRIAFTDGEHFTKYTLPFVDAAWTVPFIVLDLVGGPPKFLEGPVHLDGPRLRTPLRTRDLRAVGSIPINRFEVLVHFDPWWAFRGVSGVDRRWIEAVFATNIAHSFLHEGRTLKLHDLTFSSDLAHLKAVVAKDEVFRHVTFGPADIELLELRLKAHSSRYRAEAPSAKAL